MKFKRKLIEILKKIIVLVVIFSAFAGANVNVKGVEQNAETGETQSSNTGTTNASSSSKNSSDSKSSDKKKKGVLSTFADWLANLLIQLAAWVCDVILQALTWFMYNGSFDNYNMVIKKGGKHWTEISSAPSKTDNIVEVKMPSDMRKSVKYPYTVYSPEEIFAGKEPSGKRIALLDINFINKVDKDKNGNPQGYVGQINGWLKLRNTIASWYMTLRTLALVSMLATLVYTGIKMVTSSIGKDKAKYKQMITDWIMALVILFSMHFIMAFILTSIEQVNTLFTNGTTGTRTIKITNNGVTFYTNVIGQIRYGVQQDDIGLQFVYLGIYAFLIAMTFKFTMIYVQRTLKMAFLTIIAPIVAATYPIDKMADGSAQGFNMWLKEYTFNALIQPVHYLMYKVLVTSAIGIAANNVIYVVVILLFMQEAEDMFKKIFGFNRGGGKVPGLNNSNAIAAGTIANNLIHNFGNIGEKAAQKNIRRPRLEDIDAPSAVNADAVNFDAFSNLDEDEIDNMQRRLTENEQKDEDNLTEPIENNETGNERLRSEENSNSEVEKKENPVLDNNDDLDKPEQSEDFDLSENGQNLNTQEKLDANTSEENNEQESHTKLRNNNNFDVQESGFKFSNEELASKTKGQKITQNNSNRSTFSAMNATSLYKKRIASYNGDNRVLRTASDLKNAVLPERLKSSKEILQNAGINLDKDKGTISGTAKNLFKRGRKSLANKLGIDRNKSVAANTARLVGKTIAKGTRFTVQVGVGAIAGGLVFSASLADGKANPFEALATGMVAAKATGKIAKTGSHIAIEAGRTVQGVYRESKYGAKNANMMKYLELARNDKKLDEKFVKKYGIEKADEMKERYLQEYVPRGISDFTEFTQAVKYADKVSEERIKADTEKLEQMELEEITREWLKESKNVNGNRITNKQRVENYIKDQEAQGKTVTAQVAIESIRNMDQREKYNDQELVQSEFAKEYIAEGNADLDRYEKDKKAEIQHREQELKAEIEKKRQEGLQQIENERQEGIRREQELIGNISSQELNLDEYDETYKEYKMDEESKLQDEFEFITVEENKENETRIEDIPQEILDKIKENEKITIQGNSDLDKIKDVLLKYGYEVNKSNKIPDEIQRKLDSLKGKKIKRSDENGYENILRNMSDNEAQFEQLRTVANSRFTQSEPEWIKNVRSTYLTRYTTEKNNKIIEILSDPNLSIDEQQKKISELNQEYSESELLKRSNKEMENDKEQIISSESEKRYKTITIKTMKNNVQDSSASNENLEEIYEKRNNDLKNQKMKKLIKEDKKRIEKEIEEKQKKLDEMLKKAEKDAEKEIEEAKKSIKAEMETKRKNLTTNSINREVERRRKIDDRTIAKQRAQAKKKESADKIRKPLGNKKLTDDEAFKIANRYDADKLASSVIALYNIVKSENPKALYSKKAREAYIQDKISEISDPLERARQEKYYRNGFKQIAKQRNVQNFE